MSEYLKSAEEIIAAVGGMDNIQSMQHCMTRLRLTLKDRAAVDEDKLKDANLVKGINDSAGQLQIILGTGVVNKVYKEAAKLAGEDKTANVAKGGNLLQRLTRVFGDIFIPILPAIIASGMLMGIRSYLLGAGLLTADSAWFKVLAILIDTAFTFLPVLVTWSATVKFGGSPVLGIVLGLMLISSNLPAAPAVGRGQAEPLIVNMLGINFKLVGYQGSVLIAVVGGWLLSFIETKVRKIIPNVIDMILTPIVTLTATLFIILFGIGPVVKLVEAGIVAAFTFLFDIPFGIGGFIIGGLQQVLVITGMHHGLWIIDINFLETTGMNPYMPVRNAAVLGQAGACLAFFIASRDKKLRSVSAAASVSGLFGITEPAIFGTNLPYTYPFVFGMLGSAVGGMLALNMGLAAPGMGTAGIPGIFYFLGNNLGLFLIQSLVTLAIPFILTSIYIRKKGL